MNSLIRFLLCAVLIGVQTTYAIAATGAGGPRRQPASSIADEVDEESAEEGSLSSPGSFYRIGSSVTAGTPSSTYPLSPPPAARFTPTGLTVRQDLLLKNLLEYLNSDSADQSDLANATHTWATSIQKTPEETATWNTYFVSEDVSKLATNLAQHDELLPEDRNFILAFWFTTGMLRDDLFPFLSSLIPGKYPFYLTISAPASPRRPVVAAKPDEKPTRFSPVVKEPLAIDKRRHSF